MKKNIFKQLKDMFLKRAKHVAKSQQFQKLRDNPAGSKFRKWSSPESRRGCDGTLR